MLASLLVGLVVTNYFRRKTKGNLNLISKQKKELEQVHQELKDAQVQIVAQEKYEQARVIAGGVAHEIRNALAPAIHALDTLKSKLKGLVGTRPEVSGLLALSEKAVARALRMTELVRIYSKIESEKTDEPVSLLDVVGEITDAQGQRLDAMSVTWSTDIPADLKVKAGRQHLISVFTNLIVNALDALETVSNRQIAVRAESEGGLVRISVVDSGTGISEKDLSKVFEVFFSTRPAAGTGLGLAVTKKIVELYDGEISVESTVDKGTEFIILFPQA